MHYRIKSRLSIDRNYGRLLSIIIWQKLFPDGNNTDISSVHNELTKQSWGVTEQAGKQREDFLHYTDTVRASFLLQNIWIHGEQPEDWPFITCAFRYIILENGNESINLRKLWLDKMKIKRALTKIIARINYSCCSLTQQMRATHSEPLTAVKKTLSSQIWLTNKN